MYAVVDVETTGLRPGRHDRVVEVAVVQVDAAGRVEREWSSLVNPERDLGPQAVHGIRAAEARRAPTFARLAGSIAALLYGRVVVAHNLRFDASFLAHEYRRLGWQVPLAADLGLCTMALAGRFLPGAGRSLADCCQVAGIPLDHAHAALFDARAAAGLLTHYLGLAGRPEPWADLLAQAPRLDWPPLPDEAVTPVTREAAGAAVEHFLYRMSVRLPRLHDPRGDAYLALLDRALLDRYVSAGEADALVAEAARLELDRYEVMALHQRYLHGLAAAALADGEVTDEERADLTGVAALLGLTDGDVSGALDSAARHPAPESRAAFRLQPGDVVVFTGEMGEPRAVWERRARDWGLTVGGSVTKKTRLLVAADPDSLSGKARQAARYGIPVVGPSAFARLVPEG